MWLSEGIKEVIVYKSIANNVWANLALEDWIMKNVEMARRRILFVWRNLPVVVIGRHQNPWTETNIPLIRERNIALARRRSGGGAVYHDLGNLNFTIFAHRTDYNRPRNLQLVCDAINKEWGTPLQVNKKDDILYSNQWKVSGSSARLVKDSSYHHFTLLLSVDQTNLSSTLKPHPSFQTLSSTATASIRSDVVNLSSLNPHITHDHVVRAVADKFYKVHRVEDQKKVISIQEVVEVDPSCENTFPGISDLQIELEKWEWVYGKTPKFSFQSEIHIDDSIVDLMVEVGKGGLISECCLEPRGHHWHAPNRELLLKICELLQGSRWWRDDVAHALEGVVDEGGVAAHICHRIMELA